jgi:NTE family protein
MVAMTTGMKTGLVLAGGAARGAYEAGVLSYLREEFEPQFGRALKLDILAGTSVGAIHACYLAATSHDPRQQAQGLIAHWHGMKVEEVLRCSFGDVFRLLREALSKPVPHSRDIQYGGLVDPRGLRSLVGRGIPWLQIGRNLRKGHLEALAISATHVGTGGATVFVQRGDGTIPQWSDDPDYRAVATRVGPHHAGALEQEREQAVASAPFLVGKMLNMLMTDRTDQDLGRLRRLNAILEAGTAAYGPGFAEVLSSAVNPHRSQPVRYVRELLVRPSRDLGELAAEYVKTAEFRKRSSGLAHKAIMRLVEREAPREADMASYLLFDGGFADILINLGRQDARALRAQWERFWSEEPQTVSEAALMNKTAAASAA